GLAIPSSLARGVVESLIKNGKAVRGYLGVAIQPVTPALAQEFKLPDTRGAIVSDVQPGSPADKAGLKVGDVVVALKGRETPDPPALRIATAGFAPGTEVPLEFYRGGKKTSANVVIGELPGDSGPAGLTSFGFRVREIKPGGGAEPILLIDAVVRGSLAARSGLIPGLRVVAVGKTEVHTKADFDKAVAAFTPEQGLPLRIQSPDGKVASVTLGGPGVASP
ncbi:MAG: PDZ domain-containing protein, partial [Planctomycetia bacterium]|nr:PDZ domain-containing protein [Planctomycetia bacterium]